MLGEFADGARLSLDIQNSSDSRSVIQATDDAQRSQYRLLDDQAILTPVLVHLYVKQRTVAQ